MNATRFRVSPIPFSDTKEWILKKHYAHRIPSVSFAFGLFDDNMLVGVCTYGHPVTGSVKKMLGDEYYNSLLELNRLVVNDNLPKNTLSWFVAQTFKLLPKPVPIVSYADTAYNHHGYIYQATNWIYTGTSEPFTDYKVKGYENLHNQSICDMVGRADENENVSGKSRYKLLVEKFGADNVYKVERSLKHRYFMFLGNKREVRRMMNALHYKIKPYPKGDNKRYDSSYTPTVQLTLF